MGVGQVRLAHLHSSGTFSLILAYYFTNQIMLAFSGEKNALEKIPFYPDAPFKNIQTDHPTQLTEG